MAITKNEVMARGCIEEEDYNKCKAWSMGNNIHGESTFGIMLADTIWQFTDLVPIHVTDHEIEVVCSFDKAEDLLKVIKLCVNDVPEVIVSSGTDYLECCNKVVKFTVFIFHDKLGAEKLEKVLDSKMGLFIEGGK